MSDTDDDKLDCLAFRRAIGADPLDAAPALAAHAAACPSCRAMADRLRALEAKLAPALRVDVAAVRRAAEAPASPASKGRALPGLFGLAAALVVAVGIWFGLVQQPAGTGSAALAAEVLAHVDHEPGAWVRTRIPVADAALAASLEAGGVDVDRGRFGPITYVKTCPINGRPVPHFTVQGERGPVMVLLMAEERIEEPIVLAREGYEGVILPVGDGSVAIVGLEGESIDALSGRIGGAVEFTL